MRPSPQEPVSRITAALAGCLRGLMNRGAARIVFGFLAGWIVAEGAQAGDRWHIVAGVDNDLVRVLIDAAAEVGRFDDAATAVRQSPPGDERGDGSLGLLEGFRSKIYHDGSQSALWWRRADNVG